MLRATGRIRHRPEGTVNPDLPTGEVEILVSELEILNDADTPPFQLEERNEVHDDTRLKYRYIDLRTSRMRDNLTLRAQVARIRHIRPSAARLIQGAGFGISTTSIFSAAALMPSCRITSCTWT